MSDRSPEAAQQVAVGALQQTVVDDVSERYRSQPADVIAQALRDRFADAGLACPPDPWLMSAAAEIAAGQLYVVGNGLEPEEPFENPAAGPKPNDQATGDGDPIADPDALWFNAEQKIAHRNPADAVEHADAQPVAVEELRHSAPEDMPSRGGEDRG